MKKLFYIFLFSLSVTFISCGDFSKLNNINTQEICKLFKVESVAFSNELGMDTNKGSRKIIKMIVRNSPVVIEPEAKNELTISKAAYLFYEQLQKEDLIDFAELHIVVEGVKEGQEYYDDITFYTQDLKNTQIALQTINDFFNTIFENTSEAVKFYDEESLKIMTGDSIIKELTTEVKLKMIKETSEFIGFGVQEDKIAVVYKMKTHTQKYNYYNFVFINPTKITRISILNHLFQ